MFKSLIKHSFFIAFCMLLIACGKSTEEETKDTILSANNYLSSKECQKAIDALEGIGRQNKNPRYLKTLASAYACRAEYSTITFFANDISKTTSPAPLGGMTTYSTSQVTPTVALANDSSFKDLQTAIDILLYAGGIDSTTEPKTVERQKYFAGNVSADINAQLAFMLLAQTGKLMKVYGNAKDGEKGQGTSGNTCFTDYSGTDAAVQAYVILGGATGACTTSSSSHPDLIVAATNRRARLCQGVVLLNSLIDVLPSVLASAGGGDLDDIKDMTEDIETYKKKLTDFDPTFGATATVLNQKNCETDSAITIKTLESYYAVIYESLVY